MDGHVLLTGSYTNIENLLEESHDIIIVNFNAHHQHLPLDPRTDAKEHN